MRMRTAAEMRADCRMHATVREGEAVLRAPVSALILQMSAVWEICLPLCVSLFLLFVCFMLEKMAVR